MAILTTDCPHCRTNRVACSIKWQSVRGNDWLILAICGACRMPITAQLAARYDTKPMDEPADIEDSFYTIQTWPTTSELSAPRHTPDPVAKRFIEAEKSYAAQSWISAVLMYRTTLDVATKGMEGVPPGLTFYKRLEWLHDNNRITGDMKDWADHVRLEGNDAAHDPEDFSQSDAEPLRLFTETFLRYAFELPGEVAKFRAATE